ncbi:hypothetical protein CLV51_10712 [Chitinophaga niastensis]|uniref:Uncharacterized protein n=1 Tax=Chitinophaga niastensis TaxID=536980 RepID=A0A2P8HBV0_CHINA|nr:hypothetical protein [Chitinophaga niastensis]PSL43703.1 hypothetical protein CLV51_10712 [Chitinophaga niastensis]
MFGVNLKLYDIFRKDLHLSDDKARELVDTLDESLGKQLDAPVAQLATKSELKELEGRIKTSMYVVGIVQFIAIIGTLIAVVNFMIKK